LTNRQAKEVYNPQQGTRSQDGCLPQTDCASAFISQKLGQCGGGA